MNVHDMDTEAQYDNNMAAEPHGSQLYGFHTDQPPFMEGHMNYSAPHFNIPNTAPPESHAGVAEHFGYYNSAASAQNYAGHSAANLWQDNGIDGILPELDNQPSSADWTEMVSLFYLSFIYLF